MNTSDTQEIAELRRLCEALPDGPWTALKSALSSENAGLWFVGSGRDYTDRRTFAECYNEDIARWIAAAREWLPALLAPTERREGHSKLVYNKATRTIDTVDPHPPARSENSPERATCTCPLHGFADEHCPVHGSPVPLPAGMETTAEERADLHGEWPHGFGNKLARDVDRALAEIARLKSALEASLSGNGFNRTLNDLSLAQAEITRLTAALQERRPFSNALAQKTIDIQVKEIDRLTAALAEANARIDAALAEAKMIVDGWIEQCKIANAAAAAAIRALPSPPEEKS